MSTTTFPFVALEDARRLEREAGLEWVDGHIVEKPVSIESSKVGARILRLLGNDAEESGVAEVFDSSLGYKVFPEDPEKFRKPDVSVVRSERLAGIDASDGFMRIPADLVVEVLSPTDLAYAVTEKVEQYLQHGFRLIWVVHPNTRSVTIYRRNGDVALLHAHDEITGEDILPTFRHKVGGFFQRGAIP